MKQVLLKKGKIIVEEVPAPRVETRVKSRHFFFIEVKFSLRETAVPI